MGRITIDSVDPFKITDVDLSEMGIQTLPESICELNISGNLDLNGNELASLPESIGSIKVGGRLYLNNNKLTSLPKSIGSIKVGGHLYLNNNKLTSLPKSIGSIKVGGNLCLGSNNLPEPELTKADFPHVIGMVRSVKLEHTTHTDDNPVSASCDRRRGHSTSIMSTITKGLPSSADHPLLYSPSTEKVH